MIARCRKSRADYPDGVLAIYDNGGRTSDRYSVVYAPFTAAGREYYPTLSMSERPMHPQGVGLRGEYYPRPTRLPGERLIAFAALPDECRACVISDLAVEGGE
jgi:hypothetical protein